MTFSFLGTDPVEQQVVHTLQRIADGATPSDVESAQVDVKEEPERRRKDGTVRPGEPENEGAARYLAAEMACMANSPGGGAIIVGLANSGERIGTELNTDWLRHRVWELSDRKLTINARPIDFAGTRLVVLTTHEAIEPVRIDGKLRWRVADHCVDIDPTSWHTGHLRRIGVDWSAQRSGHRMSDVSSIAIEIARRYLVAAGDSAATDLADATNEDLLRRLNVTDADGYLTNAGSLLFVATPTIGIDYIRRDAPGMDSAERVRSERSLLEQVFDVEKVAQNWNRVTHLADGFVHAQVRAVPQRAIRESIVNGMTHRDWLSPQPTTVEHVGDIFTVTSPGGLIGGIEPGNIITHPAVARYRSLAEALATLRLAEREGIGIDRMTSDMLSLGHPAPEVAEIAGPYVRVTLIGGEPDQSVVELLNDIRPSAMRNDVDVLLLLRHLITSGWFDIASAAPSLQRSLRETEAAIVRLAVVRLGSDSLIEVVAGIPAGGPLAWRLNRIAQHHLQSKLLYLSDQDARSALILEWARARGRVSSTEVADLTDITVPYAGSILVALADDGELTPSRPNRSGRGFHYVPTRVVADEGE